MNYTLKCECGNIIEEEKSIQEGPSQNLKCVKCGERMRPELGTTIRIPEHMQAGTDAVSPTTIGNMLNRKRPSGKRKALHALGGI